jgi:hypothetical protein
VVGLDKECRFPGLVLDGIRGRRVDNPEARSLAGSVHDTGIDDEDTAELNDAQHYQQENGQNHGKLDQPLPSPVR